MWAMVVGASGCEDASRQQGLEESVKWMQQNIGKSWRTTWFSLQENYDLGESLFSSTTSSGVAESIPDLSPIKNLWLDLK